MYSLKEAGPRPLIQTGLEEVDREAVPEPTVLQEVRIYCPQRQDRDALRASPGSTATTKK